MKLQFKQKKKKQVQDYILSIRNFFVVDVFKKTLSVIVYLYKLEAKGKTVTICYLQEEI